MIYWNVISSKPKFPLDSMSYLRINGETFELTNLDVKHTTFTKTETIYRTIELNDSSKTKAIFPEIQSDSKHYDMFVTPLPHKVSQKLKSAVIVEFRIYFGYQPYTIKFSKRNVKRIRQLLSE